jgi:hypothetical protein
MDFSNSLDLVGALIRARNETVAATDRMLPFHFLARLFLPFDLAVTAWWKLRRDPRAPPPLATPRSSKQIRTLGHAAATVGIGTLVPLAGPAVSYLLEGPIGELVREALVERGVDSTRDWFGQAAGAILLAELRRGRQANPDVLLNELPQAFASAVISLAERLAAGQRRMGSSLSARLLLLIDGLDQLEMPSTLAARTRSAIATILRAVDGNPCIRVLGGARTKLPRLEADLQAQLAFVPVSDVPRQQIRDRLRHLGCTEPERDRIEACLFPFDAQQTTVHAYAMTWGCRRALPDAVVSRAVARLASRLGPGLHASPKVEALAQEIASGLELERLVRTMDNGEAIWMWAHPNGWAVSEFTPGEAVS